MDIHMPEMNGIEATGILRKMNNYKSKPIYAVTADVSKTVTEHVKNNLFSGKFIKPFDPNKMHQLIKRILTDGQL
jgi:CheY-like chemotaxis protein